jgi:polysaccharide biosynthesis protein PslH
MRILWLSHFLPFPATGHGALQRSHNLLKETARRHEVHLVAMATGAAHAESSPRRHAIAALESMVASVRTDSPAIDLFGLRRGLRVATAATSNQSYWEHWLWSPRMNDMVREVVESGVDMIHVDSVFLARYLHAAPGMPFVLNHHNIESDLLLKRAELRGGLARRSFFQSEARKVARLECLWSPRAHANLVVSALDGERLKALVGDVPTTVVSNGVDVDFFAAASGDAVEPKRMVFAGGMDWFPNQDAMEYFARDLWPALSADDPARSMTVIGRSPPAGLLDAARSDSRVRVLGFVDDVRPHVCEAPIYLCPIRVGGGTRLKILDALAMSRALVSTAIGVEGLDLVDGVHYLRAETPEQFVRQVRRIEEDESLRARLASAGRALVEQQYSWTVVADALDQALLPRDAVRQTAS